MVVVFPLPAGPLRSNNLLGVFPLKTSASHWLTSATFFLCTASSSSDTGPYFSVHGLLSSTTCCRGCDGGGVLRAPVAVRRNFCLPFAALSLSAVLASFTLLRTGSEVDAFRGPSSLESKISSTSASGVAALSGLPVGCTDCDRGTLLKKDVMGLMEDLGLAGNLAGEFLAVVFDGFGDAARRVCVRVVLTSRPARLDMLASEPLLGGGECVSASSESDESTIGFLRAARGLTIPPRVERPRRNTAAN